VLVGPGAGAHPDLQSLLSHPPFPREKEQLAGCPNTGKVYHGLSGWIPKYIDDQVLHYAGSVLQDKVMFGTDYPMIHPEDWLESFEKHTDFDESVQRKILYENAEEFLGLS